MEIYGSVSEAGELGLYVLGIPKIREYYNNSITYVLLAHVLGHKKFC